MAADPPDFPYRRLAAELRTRAELLGPNERMPSLEDVCQEYGRSLKTVRKAYALLQDEGTVVILPSLGVFTPPPRE